MGTLHSQSEPHITKHSWLGRIFKTQFSPFQALQNTHSRWTSSQCCVHSHLQGCGLTGAALPGAEQSRAEQRGVQDTENPAGETEVNLALSIWRLSRRTRTKMWPVVFIVSIQLPERCFFLTVSSASVFSLKSTIFTFFVQVLKKLWSHCKRNNVLVFQSWDWI